MRPGVRILDRLVGGTFLKLFALSILATPPLFILGEVTEDLDDYVDRGLTGLEVAQAFLFKMPLYVQYSFPVAGLIAAVFTVYAMTTHREVVAAKAGGVSFYRLVAPILLIATGLTAVALGLTEVVPRSNRVASEILRNEERQRDWRTDFVYQTDDGLTLSVRRLTLGDNRMSGVVVQRPPSDTLPALHVEARTATWSESLGWTFHTGIMRTLPGDGEEEAHTFESLRLAGLSERPGDLMEEPRDDEEMTYAEIDRLATIIERSGGEPHELKVKKEQKLAIPVATFVIILFGIPLSTSSRRGGTAYGVGIALGSTLSYILLLRISGGLGASGAIPPLWAAWTPNVLFAVVGLVLLWRVKT